MYKTEQEEFWSGEFGNEYISRNKMSDLLPRNLALYSKILGHTKGVNSVIEFGANIGGNLKAIEMLKPGIKLGGVEINKSACEKLKSVSSDIEIYNESILDFKVSKKYDMSLISGVCIHINPDELNTVYEKLYISVLKYICLVEYYNPEPIEVVYRGNKGKLFKRDFAGEILDKYPDLDLVDYGFVYHRDNNFMFDDATWFLLKKK